MRRRNPAFAAAIAALSGRIRRRGVRAVKAGGGAPSLCAAKSPGARRYCRVGGLGDSPATASRAISTLPISRSPSGTSWDRRRSASSAKRRRPRIKSAARKIPQPPIVGARLRCAQELAWTGAVGGAPHLSARPAISCLPDCALGWQDAFRVGHSLSPRRAARQQVIARKMHFTDFHAGVDRRGGQLYSNSFACRG
jgi:hypothetical protein